MSYKRLISRLDHKGDSLIKGIQLEGLRNLGKLENWITNYYQSGVDEILLLDAVASNFGSPSIHETIRKVTEKCFVPITVGGGIRNLQDADSLFRVGADKVALNTAAIQSPSLIQSIAEKYGTQAVVVSVEAKKTESGQWLCYVDNGRERTDISVEEWIARADSLGAGEFLVTSIDQDGTLRGPDHDLLLACRKVSNRPMVASGGFKSNLEIQEVLSDFDYQGVALGSALHYNKLSLPELRFQLKSAGVEVR